MNFKLIHIKLTECYNCRKKLMTNINWYFKNDNVFCSKYCRNIIYKRPLLSINV